jgi:hypothetical protein
VSCADLNGRKQVFNFGIRSLIPNYYKKYICLPYIMYSVSQQEYLTNEILLPHNISQYHNMQDKINKLIIYILGSSSLNLVYVVDWYAKIQNPLVPTYFR